MKTKRNLITAVIFAIVMMFAVNTAAFAASSKGINHKKVTLEPGDTVKLKINGKSKANWRSSNKKVATVSSKGLVRAKKKGTAKISAKVKGKTWTCKVTVKKTINGVITINSEAEKENTAVLDSSTSGMTSQEAKVYKAMIALKNKYPEGMTWTNDNYYKWNGGIYAGGYGCAAFAFLLSDAAFGTASTEKHTNLSAVKVGDILRVDDDTHSVIVLKKTSSYVIVAEGNYDSSVHWGRVITMAELRETADYVMTRYA